MVILGIAGYSGSGKTTLLVRLIPLLRARGISVSTMKHTHHNVSIDRRASLSRRLREAGATEVAVAAPGTFALMHELRGGPEPGPAALAQRMRPVDLLLIEGFKRYEHPKIEVHRPALEKPPLYPHDPSIIAVASDRPIPGLALPRLDLDDVAAIAEFVIARFPALVGAAGRD